MSSSTMVAETTEFHLLSSRRDSFVGREQETRDVLRLLSRPDVACLTLLGPGGVGKTRLMTQVAATLKADAREPFADGIWFVPLAAVTDADRAPLVLAEVLGLELADEAPAAAVIDFLRERESLLILDNVEQVIEIGPFVAELATECRDVKIVVTSRRPLRISGEQEYALSPLPLPGQNGASVEQLTDNPAVALFMQRARMVNPRIEFDARTLEHVAEICRGLDGLPLAIELAGARVKALSPSVLAAQLSNRLRVLTGGPRDAPTRQQTLRSAIAWSYDILTPREQELYRRLAVFSSGFNLTTAEQLDAELSAPSQPTAQEPLDVIAALVDHSLLIAVDTALDDPRWTMLQTIREFGLEQLAALGEEQSVRKAHAKVITKMATDAEAGIYGKDQPIWLKRLTAEDANIRSALTWSLENNERELALLIAGSLWRFWSLRHAGKEGREWLARAIAAPGEASLYAQALAFRGAGCLAEDIGDYETAELRHGQALALWEELGDDVRRARSIDDIGNTAHDQGDFERAIALHNLAYEVGETCGNRRVMASAMSNLGAVAYLQGNISLARERWQAVLNGTTIDDPVSQAMVMNNLAVAYMHEGDLDRAASILEDTLAIHNELGTLSTRADVYTNLSDVATRQGNHDRARAYFAQAIELYQLAEDPKGLHNSYFSLGTEEAGQGNAQASLAAFCESLRYADRANNRIGVADTIDQIALLAVSTELAEEAARLTGAARAIRERLGSTGMPNHQQVLAELEAELKRSLGESRYARAIEEGAEITQRQATSRALALADRLAEMTLPSKAKVAPATALSAAPANPFKLTKREVEVLRLLAQGHTDREIAAELWISPRTAGSHVTNIFGKLDVDSRAAAVAVAFRNDLI